MFLSLLLNMLSPLYAVISPHYTDSPVRLVDKEDALVAATVEALGPGWRIVPPVTVCKDSTTCRRITKGDCLTPQQKKRQNMLIKCRKACKKLLIEEENFIPEDINAVGGVDDIFIDPFGFKLNICSEADGFDEAQRTVFVDFNMKIELLIPYIPKFTLTGIEKTRVPSDLLSFLDKKIKDGTKANNWTVETSTQPGVINNQFMAEKGGEEDSRRIIRLNRTMLLTLDSETYKRVVMELLPLAEDWAGVQLEFTSIYGVRRYLNNSALISHIDRFIDSFEHLIKYYINT